MANPTVTVSAVPFNPNTQTFGATPTQTNSYSMGTVNLNAPTQQTTTPTNPIVPSNIPQSQNIGTFSTQKINFPQTNPTQTTTPTTNYPASYLSAQPTEQQQQDKQIVDYNTNLFKTIANLAPQLSGQTEAKIAAQNNLGLPDMRKQLTDYNNQILQKNAELNQSDVSLAQGLQNIQDQAIPMQFITGQQASMQNQAQLARAVKVSNINMLNALAQSTQNNIQLAQQTAQEAVDLKYAPIKDMYNVLIAQQEAIKPLLTSAEKRISDQQSAVYELQKTLLSKKQDQESKFMDLVLKAPTDYGSTPEQVSKAIQTYQQTGDIMQAANALSGAAGSYLSLTYSTDNAIRNATYNGIGQLTVDNGYDLNAFKKGIAGVESSNNYNAIGPATKSGDKAYGKYQVMGANIPSWTEQAGLGRMTPQQFLNSPQAQEKVFENQSLTNYAKYGNWDDVASVWFSGKPLASNTASDGYNTVPQYVAKVRQNMGIPSQPTVLSTVTNPTVKTFGDEYIRQGRSSDFLKTLPKYVRQEDVLAYANQNVKNNPQTQALVEKINSLDSLINDKTLSTVVGPNILARGTPTFGSIAGKTLGSAAAGALGGSAIPGIGTIVGALGGAAIGLSGSVGQAYPYLTGEAQNFLGSVEQLTSQETIDKLIQAKAQGATFGALSDQERVMLRDAATKINKWAVKDGDGNTIGYNIDENNFIKELQTLKNLAQKGIARSGGNILGGTVAEVKADTIMDIHNNMGTTTGYNIFGQ